MKKIILFTNLLIFTVSIAQSNRKAFTLEIAADETQQYVAEIPESPYFIKEKMIQLYCGEKVFIECEIVGDSIATMKVVELNINPEKTIEVDFKQNAEDRTDISTILSVKNPFNKSLIYDAIMFTPISQTWKRTSIIPIRPNLMNFETWPYAVVTLALEKWRFEN